MSSPLTPQEWHAVFQRQATWTRPAREYLYRKAGLRRARHILDVGCGSGVVTEEMASRSRGGVLGLDIDDTLLALTPARSRAHYLAGDAYALPFPSSTFDVVTSHFVLLWLREPVRAVREMVRVTRRGGWILACAEPDYGGRLDYPDLPIGQCQAEALRQEGADPHLGRKLRAVFSEAGLRSEVSLISGPWDVSALRASFEGEWGLLDRTVSGFMSKDELQRVRDADWESIEAGTRLVFQPVFCAAARV